MLADSVIEINSARLMVLHAAWTIDQGLDARDWISMVKVQAAEMLGRVTDRAVQVFGGMGYCKETLLPRRPDLPDFRRHIRNPSHGNRTQPDAAWGGAVRCQGLKRDPAKETYQAATCLALIETGVPLSAALPVRGSTRSLSVRLLMLTPGCSAAARMPMPGR